MAVNKVIYDGNTLIDLTSDSVTPDTLLVGETAHDATGAQITGTMRTVPNSELLGGKSPDYYLCHPNLLMNGNFANPVNRRGATSYDATQTFVCFAIDGWMCLLASCTLNDGYITVATTNGGFMMTEVKADEINESVLTFAACRLDGTIHVASCDISAPNTDAADPTGSIAIGTDEDSVVMVMLMDGDWKWAAVYEGEYTAETLPPYVHPNHKIEALKFSGKEVIWENASPTSTFAAQTVSLDLSGVSEIEIVTDERNNYDTYFCITRIPVDGNKYTLIGHGNMGAAYRFVAATETGVMFGPGVTMTPTTSSSGWEYGDINYLMVPMKISAITI